MYAHNLLDPNWFELAEIVDDNQLGQRIGNGNMLLILLCPHSHTTGDRDKEIKMFDFKNREII